MLDHCEGNGLRDVGFWDAVDSVATVNLLDADILRELYDVCTLAMLDDEQIGLRMICANDVLMTVSVTDQEVTAGKHGWLVRDVHYLR